MTMRGVHFAITAETADRLKRAAKGREVVSIVDEIEEEWDEDHLVESDKAWDAIHRCLADGKLTYECDRAPWSDVILGGRDLSCDDSVISLKYVQFVPGIARALSRIDKEWMRKRYLQVDASDYGHPLSDEDFEYAWDNFIAIRDFYARAASEGRAVLFSAR